MHKITTEQFKQVAALSMKDKVLQKALARFQKRIGPATAASYLALPEGPELRQKAKEIRMAGQIQEI